MVLINRNFSLLWFGQLVSQLGDKAYAIALTWWLLERTGSSLYVSSFLVIAMLPELIFGPIAGVYVDHWDRKRILFATDALRGLIVSTVTALHLLGRLQIWHVYLAAMGISLCSALFNPTTMAVIPTIVDKGLLPRANALSQMVAGTVSIVGPLAGATSVALIGYTGVFLFNALSFFISAGAAALIKLTAAASRAKDPLWKSLREGFGYIRSDARVTSVVIVIALVHIFYGSIVVMLPFVATLIQGTGINNLGILQAMIGGGMIVGAMVIQRRTQQGFNDRWLFYAVGLMGSAIWGLGTLQSVQVGSLVLYALVCLVLGLCIAVASVFWRTITQQTVPEQISGRVFSVCTTTGNVSLPLSIAAFGVLLRSFTPARLLVAAGICLMLISAWLVLTPRRAAGGPSLQQLG